MKVARYWALGEATAQTPEGQTHTLGAWRWSEASQQEAQLRADEAACEAARRFVNMDDLGDRYGYGNSPPREEIVREIQDDAGQTNATITRNSYGSLILNTGDLMFIDVDLPEEAVGAALMRGIKGLFGRREKTPAELLRERLNQTAGELTDYTIRLYATAAGFRCAIVNRPILPASSESENLLARFEADPLYVRLCHVQQSYRVRLTPKHWR